MKYDRPRRKRNVAGELGTYFEICQDSRERGLLMGGLVSDSEAGSLPCSTAPLQRRHLHHSPNAFSRNVSTSAVSLGDETISLEGDTQTPARTSAVIISVAPLCLSSTDGLEAHA